MDQQKSLVPLKIRLSHWMEAVFVQCDRASEPPSGKSQRGYFDPLIFVIVAATCWDILKTACTEGLISKQELAPVLEISELLVQLRNLNVHIAEYDAGEGRYPKSYHAETQFKHEPTTSIRHADGKIVIGGRIEILDCAERFRGVANSLLERDFWGFGRKPAGL